MNFHYESKEVDGITQARQSFSGRLLSDAQFEEAVAVTGILERQIKSSGSFKEKLTDYSYAMARSERKDAIKIESRVRDIFKARTGFTMNEMREGLLQRERELFGTPAQQPALSNDFTAAEAVPGAVSDEQKARAYKAANDVGQMVSEGTLLTFNRAVSYEAAILATELNITDAGAKRFMKDAFMETENRDFWEWGKELDNEYFQPQVEADKQQRQEERSQGRARQYSRS